VAELEPVDESWQRALCVVAHPDDLEFGTAAAIARWTDQGKTVIYAMVTSGEAGIDALDPAECRALLATVAVGRVPTALVLEPRSGCVYVANAADNSVSVIACEGPPGRAATRFASRRR
jgi:DNA-binding beta-propeller fold protein YncE